MVQPPHLPDHLRGRAFTRRDLDPNRTSQGRLRRKDVVNPYHGVHSSSAPTTVRDHCLTDAARLRPGQAFSHTTAALLHGTPLPTRLQEPTPLHVCCVHPASPPRTDGVVGHRLRARPAVQGLDGIPVVVPSEARCQLGAELTLDELIEVVDHLLTVSPLGPTRTRAVLVQRVRSTRREGSERLLAALDEARAPVRSPGETRVRLLLIRAGVPEPTLNDEVENAVGFVLGHADLVWRSHRLVVEYEGDDHRVDKDRFRRDVERYESFRDAGWEIVRATADDLHGWRRDRLVQRVRTRLARTR